MRPGLINPLIEDFYIIRPPRQRTHQAHERLVRVVVSVVVIFEISLFRRLMIYLSIIFVIYTIESIVCQRITHLSLFDPIFNFQIVDSGIMADIGRPP